MSIKFPFMFVFIIVVFNALAADPCEDLLSFKNIESQPAPELFLKVAQHLIQKRAISSVQIRALASSLEENKAIDLGDAISPAERYVFINSLTPVMLLLSETERHTLGEQLVQIAARQEGLEVWRDLATDKTAPVLYPIPYRDFEDTVVYARNSLNFLANSREILAYTGKIEKTRALNFVDPQRRQGRVVIDDWVTNDNPRVLQQFRDGTIVMVRNVRHPSRANDKGWRILVEDAGAGGLLISKKLSQIIPPGTLGSRGLFRETNAHAIQQFDGSIFILVDFFKKSSSLILDSSGGGPYVDQNGKFVKISKIFVRPDGEIYAFREFKADRRVDLIRLNEGSFELVTQLSVPQEKTKSVFTSHWLSPSGQYYAWLRSERGHRIFNADSRIIQSFPKASGVDPTHSTTLRELPSGDLEIVATKFDRKTKVLSIVLISADGGTREIPLLDLHRVDFSGRLMTWDRGIKPRVMYLPDGRAAVIGVIPPTGMDPSSRKPVVDALLFIIRPETAEAQIYNVGPEAQQFVGNFQTEDLRIVGVFASSHCVTFLQLYGPLPSESESP